MCRLISMKWFLLVTGSIFTTLAFSQEMNNLFFLHHSTGNNLIVEGNMRGYFDDYNATNGTNYQFWDHGYNYQGLRDPAGNYVGHSYDIPGDNTDPDGLHYLWTVANAARDSIMANHGVIAFKSCYPASAIPDSATLGQYKTWYLEMRDYFDAHLKKIFAVMSTPPLHRLATNLTEADNARAFADWLKSSTYLDGHPNVVCFDLFNELAHPDDESDARNMLRYEYELDHGRSDSHPNTLANETVGSVFAQFYIDITSEGITEETEVELSLYNICGQKIATLDKGIKKTGEYTVIWDAENFSEGIYFCRLKVGDKLLPAQKLIILR